MTHTICKTKNKFILWVNFRDKNKKFVFFLLKLCKFVKNFGCNCIFSFVKHIYKIFWIANYFDNKFAATLNVSFSLLQFGLTNVCWKCVVNIAHLRCLCITYKILIFNYKLLIISVINLRRTLFQFWIIKMYIYKRDKILIFCF